MKHFRILLLIFPFIAFTGSHAQVYKSKKDGVKISFFSETPVENITAENRAATSLIVGDSVIYRIPNKGFVFPKPLMQEHFNENYMESEKYPYSTFRGKINEKHDFTKDGSMKLTATGNMYIHGVTKNVTLTADVTVKGDDIRLLSNFTVKLVDYRIEVPKVVVKNIAEEIAVKVDVTYNPFVKK